MRMNKREQSKVCEGERAGESARESEGTRESERVRERTTRVNARECQTLVEPKDACLPEIFV